MKRTILKIVLPPAILAVSILGAVVLVKSRPAVKTRPILPPPPLVHVLRVEAQHVQLKVHAQGSVAPRIQSVLASEGTGRVIRVSPAFASGGFFEKGETLVRLDPRDAALAVTRARAEVARAGMALEIEKEEGRLAREEWKRLGKGAPTALAARQPQLAEAQATLAAARATLRQAELRLERTEIHAPFAGRVRMKNVDVGQYLTPGMAVATIYAVDYAEVRLPIPDAQLAYFDAPLHFREEYATPRGPAVVLRARFAGRSHQWAGRIVRLEGEIDPRSRMVYVVARIKNPYGRGSNPIRPPLSVGMFVEAEVMGHELDGVIVLPRTAVRGRDQVLVVDENDRLRFRTVDIVRREPNRVILNDGLRSGERVCLSPLETPVEGMKVRILQEEPSEPALTSTGGGGG